MLHHSEALVLQQRGLHPVLDSAQAAHPPVVYFNTFILSTDRAQRSEVVIARVMTNGDLLEISSGEVIALAITEQYIYTTFFNIY